MPDPTSSSSFRSDLVASIVCHATLIGVLLLVTPQSGLALLEKPDLTEGAASSLANDATEAEQARAAEEAAAALAAIENEAAAQDPMQPSHGFEETGKALVSTEVTQSVTFAIPETAPESVKAEVAAAIEKAVAEAMAKAAVNGGEPMTPAEIELAATEAVANELRSDVSGDYADAAAKDFPRRAFDNALGALEKAAAAEIGPKVRDLLRADGAAMAKANEDEKMKAEFDAAAAKAAANAPPDPGLPPRDVANAGKVAAKAAADAAKVAEKAIAAADPGKATALLAMHDKDPFQKSLDAEAKSAISKTAASILADNAATAVRELLAKENVSADESALSTMREAMIKGVVENAAGRGFDTGAVWKPSGALVLPSSRREDNPGEALTTKLSEVGGKQDALVKEAMPRLAAETAKNVKWNNHIPVSNETKGKITTIHRLETHIANIKSGRVGAAESSLAASLSSLLNGGDSGQGTEQPADVSSYGSWNGLGGSGRRFKEDEYRKLIARLGGRPANAGAEADLQRVAGDPGQTVAAQAGAGAPERMVSLKDPVAEPPAAAVTVEPVAPPPFPSVTHTAALYAVNRPAIDGDLSDWNLSAPRAEVRVLENNSKLVSGPDVFLQWRAEGLYFAYQLADMGGVQVSNGAPYYGDCVELFVDASNSRAPRMRESNTAHQYFFMPFGYKGDGSCTFQRAFRGAPQPTGKDIATLNRERNISFCTAKPEPGGYTVEGFISIEVMERRLAPGIYLGFDISVSPDLSIKNQMQWAAAKSLGNWDRPSTWGDLLLLGTSAKVGFRSADGSARKIAVAGESVLLEIADADMNLDTTVRETVAIRLAGSAAPQVLLLTETGADTGVFQSSILFESSGGLSRAGTFPVSGGDTLTLTYIDAVNASGTRNKTVAAKLEIGWPVMRFSAR